MAITRTTTHAVAADSIPAVVGGALVCGALGALAAAVFSTGHHGDVLSDD